MTFPLEEKTANFEACDVERFATQHKNRLDFLKLLKRSKISHKNVTGLQMAVLLNLSSSFYFVQLFCTTTMLLAVLSRFQVILWGVFVF